MPRRLIPSVTLALLSVLGLASAVLSIKTEGRVKEPRSASAHPRLPIGSPQYGFGGYQLYPEAPVTSMSGEWTVPTVAASSAAGDASTWIGVQSAGGAFAQVGTVENRTTGDQYYAFWSDTAKNFRPLYLSHVAPGDHVEAEMTLKPEGWALTIVDMTSASSSTIQSHYGSSDSFNSCEWLQENPVYGQFVHTNYPTLSTVAFEDMKLNHYVPMFNFFDAQTLSTDNDSFFVPTRVRHDKFTLLPATGAALGFLEAVYIEDQLGSEFFESATQGITPGNTVTNAYIAGLGLDLPLLESLSVPKKISPALSSYIANQKYLETYMTHWLQEPPAQRSADLTNVANQLVSSDRIADRVRSLLGLPPVYG